MKTTKHLIVLATVMLLHVSCKKNDTPVASKKPVTTSQCLLTSLNQGTYTYLLNYNADKSLSEIKIAQTNLYPWDAQYTYSGDSTIVSVNNNGGKFKLVATKNAQGLVTDVRIISFGVDNEVISWMDFAYTYSGQNVNECVFTRDGTTAYTFFKFTYTNGNLTSVITYAGNENLPNTAISFTYDENTPAKPGDIFWDANLLNPLSSSYLDAILASIYPVHNKNLALTFSDTDMGKTVTNTASYTYDGNSNITSMSIINSNNIKNSQSYQYSCGN